MFSRELRHYTLPKNVAPALEAADKYLDTMRYAGKQPAKIVLSSEDYHRIAEAISKHTNGEVLLSLMTYRAVPITHTGAFT